MNHRRHPGPQSPSWPPLPCEPKPCPYGLESQDAPALLPPPSATGRREHLLHLVSRTRLPPAPRRRSSLSAGPGPCSHRLGAARASLLAATAAFRCRLTRSPASLHRPHLPASRPPPAVPELPMRNTLRTPPQVPTLRALPTRRLPSEPASAAPQPKTRREGPPPRRAPASASSPPPRSNPTRDRRKGPPRYLDRRAWESADRDERRRLGRGKEGREPGERREGGDPGREKKRADPEEETGGDRRQRHALQPAPVGQCNGTRAPLLTAPCGRGSRVPSAPGGARTATGQRDRNSVGRESVDVLEQE
ncbi:vegetative cell wall protein gp1-like [Ananas comosus]|uniref:Vegetative cell wall protein gp1-like n=1 Tax=Ananas comosus TaxID=4615 RepID=A0A6P5GB77_ANACO|nr:vegetative cell wall protein gp1-like [Ananas comosus]